MAGFEGAADHAPCRVPDRLMVVSLSQERRAYPQPEALALQALTQFANGLAAAADKGSVCRAMHASIAGLLEVIRLEQFVPSPSGDALVLIYPETDGQTAAARRIVQSSTEPEVMCAAGQCEVETGDAASRNELVNICLPMLAAGKLQGVLSVTVTGILGEADRVVLRTFCVWGAIGLATQDALRTSRLLRDALERSDEALSFYDASGRILFTNPAYHRIFAHYPPPDRLLGMEHEQLYRLDLAQGVIEDPVAQADPEAYLADRRSLFRDLQGEHRELQTIRGRTYLYVRTRAIAGATLSRRTDITEFKAVEGKLRAAQERLQELAFSDALTGLSNRLGFCLQAAQSERDNPVMSVLLLDVDRFKAINDTMGHASGDALLRAMARRLLGCVQPTDLVARLGADEFAVLLPGQSGDEAIQTAQRVLSVINTPYRIEERRIVVSASVAMSSAPEDGAGIEQLLRNADRALDRAKSAGRSSLRRFETAMDAELQERQAIGLDLPEAMSDGQLELYYQPVVDLARGVVSGLEALLRWHHPIRGMISPALFIPIAEDIGLMDELGEWVLRRACSDARHIPLHISIAVNISARQLASPELVSVVETAAAAGGLLPGRLEIEITESVQLQGCPAVLDNLHRLRGLGVRIALDDFGTGYSSLSYLCSFPFTKIKIDQSFVRGISDRADCAAIVSAAAELAASLGMSTTAEGVETKDQFDRLRAAGCTEAQGHLIAPPRPLQAVKEWLAEHA